MRWLSAQGVFHTLAKLKLTVLGDIGCYTLGAVQPLSAIDAVICMGASIGMAVGFDKADPEAYKKTVAVIGDSTFVHSGITGLIEAVYNKANATIIIVDNSTTGMTGHQNHPATGRTIDNKETFQLNIEELCKVIGAKTVTVVDPYQLKELERVIKEEVSKEGVSVIIARRPCVLLKKSTYNGYNVNDNCVNCKACLKLGCPAIISGEKSVSIDKSLCTECNLCVEVCKFSAIK